MQILAVIRDIYPRMAFGARPANHACRVNTTDVGATFLSTCAISIGLLRKVVKRAQEENKCVKREDVVLGEKALMV